MGFSVERTIIIILGCAGGSLVILTALILVFWLCKRRVTQKWLDEDDGVGVMPNIGPPFTISGDQQYANRVSDNLLGSLPSPVDSANISADDQSHDNETKDEKATNRHRYQYFDYFDVGGDVRGTDDVTKRSRQNHSFVRPHIITQTADERGRGYQRNEHTPNAATSEGMKFHQREIERHLERTIDSEMRRTDKSQSRIKSLTSMDGENGLQSAGSGSNNELTSVSRSTEVYSYSHSKHRKENPRRHVRQEEGPSPRGVTDDGLDAVQALKRGRSVDMLATDRERRNNDQSSHTTWQDRFPAWKAQAAVQNRNYEKSANRASDRKSWVDHKYNRIPSLPCIALPPPGSNENPKIRRKLPE